MPQPRAVQKFGSLGSDRAAGIKGCRNLRLQTISDGVQPVLIFDHFDSDVSRHDNLRLRISLNAADATALGWTYG
jgi:hypothetical protein